MKKVIVEVELTINADTQDELQEVLDNMDYNFSYVKIHDDYVGKGLTEVEYITNTEIIA